MEKENKMLKIASLVLAVSISLFACNSDYDCGYGNSCIKEKYSYTGVCMKNVDKYESPKYTTPKSQSILPNTSEGDCSSSDCRYGFGCDYKYKVCVKR